MRRKDKSYQESLDIFNSIKDREIINKELNRSFIHLKFSPLVENVFLDYYFSQSLSLMRISLVLSFFVYASFGILDVMLYSEVLEKMLVVRYAVGCPLILATLLYMFYVKREKHSQLAASFLMFFIGLSIMAMLIMTSADPSQKYYAGLVLVTFYAYMAIGLRFCYATAVGWAVAGAYFLLSFFAIKPGFPFLVGNTFTLFFANIIGMVGNFLFEKSVRRGFLLSILYKIESQNLKEANAKLEKLSNTDGLTKVANRRYFEEFLEREWMRAMRYKYSISLLMIDIDYFKNYNDHLGHQAGDQCLIKIASVLKTFERRPGDIVARYGGEEFVVVLSDTSAEDARRIAEEIRRKVMSLKLSHPDSSVNDVVTISIGVAAMIPSESITKEKLIEEADKFMYQAKAYGRNQTVSAKME